MNRALVVVDPSKSNADVLREAGELAADADASLVVFSSMTDDGYESDVSVLSTIESVEGASYNKNPDRIAGLAAERLAEEHLSDLAVEYETKGTVLDDDNRADAIIETAEKEGCDYVFIVGRRRSPTGKALFGDTAQAVILNFDGRVVITTA